jgi:galactokinase
MILNAAHLSLKEDYEVSCPQLDLLVEIAQSQSECFGARMVGGGFGGCTLNIVQTRKTDQFIANVLTEYRSQVTETPRSFTFELVGGAGFISSPPHA